MKFLFFKGFYADSCGIQRLKTISTGNGLDCFLNARNILSYYNMLAFGIYAYCAYYASSHTNDNESSTIGWCYILESFRNSRMFSADAHGKGTHPEKREIGETQRVHSCDPSNDCSLAIIRTGKVSISTTIDIRRQKLGDWGKG